MADGGGGMKIIKHGEIPELVPMRATCSHCHAEVEFVAAEVKRVFDQRDGDFYQFDCPVCRRSITRAVML